MAAQEQPVWRVVETVPETHEITSLVIAPPEGLAVPRRPGQFALIRIKFPEGWSEQHPFTISCDAYATTLRFTIKNVGRFTARIRGLEPGTPVQCSKAMGVFCKDINQNPRIALLAGGVGITPFLSVLRTLRIDQADNQVLLFWANRTRADSFAHEEFEAMTRELRLQVVHVFSNGDVLPEPPDQGAFHYRSGFLRRELFREFGLDGGTACYLCGPPPMQEAVLTELAACGVARESVQLEGFNYQRKD